MSNLLVVVVAELGLKLGGEILRIVCLWFLKTIFVIKIKENKKNMFGFLF